MILYVDTINNALVKALNLNQNVNPLSVQFYAGDGGETLQVYLLEPLQSQGPAQWNYQIISTAGLTLFAQLDNGYLNGESQEYGTVYTSQGTWTTDPNNQYFLGTWPMNTANALAAFTGSVFAISPYLRIGYYYEGEPTTVFCQQVTMLPGIPSLPLVTPSNLTPLSVQQALGMFVPINGGNPGQTFIMLSPSGKQMLIQVIDNPDGSISWQASPV